MNYGVVIGSLLGQSLANIFVGYYEALLFKRVNKPLMYYRYVDDIFSAFNDEDECNEFLSIHRFVSLLKRNAIRFSPFLMSLQKRTIANLLHLCTESRLSLANTFAGILFAHKTEDQSDFDSCPQSSSHMS